VLYRIATKSWQGAWFDDSCLESHGQAWNERSLQQGIRSLPSRLNAMRTVLHAHKRSLLGALALGLAVQLPLSLSPAQAQSRCYQVVAYTPPNMLRCQQIGEDYLRRPIWLCC